MKRSLIAEGIGTALLLAAVVGSGIMAERLSGGNDGIALLANAIATGAALYPLILSFDALSGAHFNPAVSLVMGMNRELSWRLVGPYAAVQTLGAIAGVWAAHLMFDLPILQASPKVRTGVGQWAGEFIATFGLIMVIECGRRRFPAQLPATVASYIIAAYWFTSSTSFANPAVTIARSFTATFAGISPANAAAFILSQLAGAVVSATLFGWLYREPAVARSS
jgi:glycerol uptake facilitator-like aquaporin